MLTQWSIRVRVILVFAIVAVLGQIALMAQAVNGTLSATVKDSSGTAIAGATVELKNTATHVVRSLTNNTQGRYQARARGVVIETPQLPSVHIGLDRASGPNVFGVA
jgi:Carboxypeptidase regulatory-like domain